MLKKTVIAAALVVGLSTSACNLAVAASSVKDGVCSVIGHHESGTNIYDGPTFCGMTTLSYITVRGPLQLDCTVITGMTDMSGPVLAKGANMQDIMVENDQTPQTVTLQAGSTVKGNITFAGPEGTVYLEAGSNILGQVINGQVIKK